MRRSLPTAVLLPLTIIACTEPTAPPPATLAAGNPALAIADGAHDDTRAGFYFLPPLVPAPEHAGTFDPTLAPVVEVCSLAGEACAGIVATFTMEGDGPERLRVDGEEEHYHVGWRTSADRLDPDTEYRVRVLLDGVELGYADVDVVTRGAGRMARDGGQVRVVLGSTLPVRFRIEEGAGRIDETAPLLTGLSFTPESVDVTAAAATVTIGFSATDDASGVAGISVVLANPSSTAQVACTATSPASGNPREGTWSCDVAFDPTSEWGFWSVSSLMLTDASGNATTLTRSDLREAGFPTMVEVIAPQGTGDITPATLFDFSFEPASLDVTGADGTVTVRTGWTDGQSGVAFVHVAFFHAGSGQFRSCATGVPSTGTSHDGTWTCSFSIPRFSAGGTWTAISVQATDAVGNHVEIGEAALAAAGLPTQLGVISNQDVSDPTLSAFSFTPTELDIRESDGVVTIATDWTDVQSGVSFVHVAFQHAGTGQFASCNAGAPASGTVNAGTWTCSFTIPRFSAAGSWTAISVQGTDAVGNHVELGKAALEAAGFPTELFVISNEDLADPALTAFSFSPTTVDVRTEDATVSVQMGWRDALSGVTFVHAAFHHPETGQFRSCMANLPQSGTPNDGTWACSFVMPQLSAAGTWRVISVQAMDAVGNHVEIGTAQLEAEGFPILLEVISGQ